jgi:competence protein ComGC
MYIMKKTEQLKIHNMIKHLIIILVISSLVIVCVPITAHLSGIGSGIGSNSAYDAFAATNKTKMKAYQEFLNKNVKYAEGKPTTIDMIRTASFGSNVPITNPNGLFPARKASAVKKFIKNYYGKSISTKTLKKALKKYDYDLDYKNGKVRFIGGTLSSSGYDFKVKSYKSSKGKIIVTADVKLSGGGGAGFIDEKGMFYYKYKNVKITIKKSNKKYGYIFVNGGKLTKEQKKYS